MKNFIILLIVINSLHVFAQDFKIVRRNKRFKAKHKKVSLSQLASAQEFATEHFILLNGATEKIINFDDSHDLVTKAANLFYHLEIARLYFEKMSLDHYLKSTYPIKIRVDVKRGFHEKFYFKGSAESLLEYNNAKSVPPGLGFPKYNIDPWGHEIWFRPSKPVHISEIGLGTTTQGSSFDQVFASFKKQFQRQSFQRYLAQLITDSNNFTRENYVTSEQFRAASLRTVGTVVMLELIWRNREKINRFFSPKYFYLDAAMVPEVIYHEFAHIALSKFLPVTHSKPVLEGYADYFATRISGHHKLTAKIKKYAKLKVKNGKNNSTYHLSLETSSQANADFVLALLWDIKSQLGPKVADELILKSLELLSDQSDIQYDLTKALITACQIACTQKDRDLLAIKRLFYERGL